MKMWMRKRTSLLVAVRCSIQRLCESLNRQHVLLIGQPTEAMYHSSVRARLGQLNRRGSFPHGEVDGVGEAAAEGTALVGKRGHGRGGDPSFS